MWRILSLLPDSLTEWVALALVAGMAFLAGYGRGADDARQECEARIAVMEKDRARQEQARAEAMAAAEKSARERLAAAIARGDRLALEVAQKTKELDAERASVNRRLAHVAETARRDCAGLTADWVRLYNQALALAGTGTGRGAESGRTGTGNAADAPGAEQHDIRSLELRSRLAKRAHAALAVHARADGLPVNRLDNVDGVEEP